MSVYKFLDCLVCANFKDEDVCADCEVGELFEPKCEELDFDSDDNSEGDQS